MDKAHAASHSDSLSIKAGATVAIPVILDSKSQEITYSFTVDGGLDVDLCCVLLDAEKSSAPVELVASKRISSHKDSLRVNLELARGAHAVLEFRLSNAYSWMRSKNIKYEISVLPEPDPVDLAREALAQAVQVAQRAEAEAARLEAASELAATAQARAALELSEAEAAAEAAARLVAARREAAAAAKSEAASVASALSAAQAEVAAAQAAAAALAASPLLLPPPTAAAEGAAPAP